MKRLLTLFTWLAALAVEAQTTLAPIWREGEVIVKFKSADATAKVRRVIQARKHAPGMQPVTALDSVITELAVSGSEAAVRTDNESSNLCLLTFDTAAVASVVEVVERLRGLDEVAVAEPNYIHHIIAPVDSPEEGGKESVLPDTRKEGMKESAPLMREAEVAWWLEAIRMPELWKKPLINNHRPVIAIIDTGVDITHPDLQGNIAEGGYDFVRDTELLTDPHGHGTHCAGLAAANWEGEMRGANPDALILPVTVMNEYGSGGLFDIIKGINYAIDAGVDIISLSIGGSNSEVYSEVIDRAIKNNIIVVAAAGNSGYCMVESHRDLHGMATLHEPCFPAAFNQVIGVMGTRKDGMLASWSNFDCDGPMNSSFAEKYNYELRAPGDDILSTVPDGKYETMSGTSMSTPIVAGAISRLLQCREFNSHEELVRTLILTSDNHIDMLAAYQANTAELLQDTLHYNVDGIDCLFVRNGEGTLQLGDGHAPAFNIQDCPTVLSLPDFVSEQAITTIAPHAFEGCSVLESLRLGCNVDSIGASAFRGCGCLADLTLTSALAPHADATTFDHTHLSTLNLHITRGYTSSFAAAPVWQEFTQWKELPLRSGNRFMALVRDPDVEMVFIIYDLDNHIGQVGAGQVAVSTKTAGRIVIPDMVKGLDIRVIDDYAFMLCRQLTEVVMPQHLIVIGGAAFFYCDSLQRVELPRYTRSIGSYAFSDCKQMKTLRLSPNITAIGSYAFSGCEALETITVPMNVPPNLPENAFDYTDPLAEDMSESENLNIVYEHARLLVPYGCRQLYAEAKGWKRFLNIEEMTADGKDPAGINASVAGDIHLRNTTIYNLQGQRVAAPADLRRLKRGIYVIGGKKVVGGY